MSTKTPTTKKPKAVKPKTAKKAPHPATKNVKFEPVVPEVKEMTAPASARRRSASGAVSTPAPAKVAEAPKTSKTTKTEKAKSQALAIVAAKIEKAEKKLDPIAKEINVRFEKAAKLEHDADDHRLAAACRLAEAQKICNDNGIKFKEWAAQHVTQAFETVRKLAAIGSAEHPKLALEDMRNRNKEANKKLRERQKTTRRSAASSGDEGEGAFAEANPDLLARAKTAFDALDSDAQVDLLFYAAEKCGIELPKL